MEKNGISQQIKSARQNLGLTQAQLAEKCNLDIRTIQRIESGLVTPRYYTINLINKVLATNINVAKDTAISLCWKKNLLSSNYNIYLNEKLVGNLMDRTFSQSGDGEFKDRKYSFRTYGLLTQKTEIFDHETSEIIGNIKYNAWMNKAQLTINHEILYWKYEDWMNTRWSISNAEGVQVKFFGSLTKGNIESTIDDGILVLTGLFITNYYLKFVFIMVLLSFFLFSRI